MAGRGHLPQDVLVLISRGPSSEALIRRGARMARRFGGHCSVLTVVRSTDESAGSQPWRAIADQLRCDFVERGSTDVAETAVAAAHELGVRHLVVGEARHRRLLGRWRPCLVDRLIDELPGTDIHVVALGRERRPGASRAGSGRPTPDDLLRDASSSGHQGRLRVHLGYAHGVGTTTAMLAEGRRRLGRGTDVVVAAVATARRRESEAALTGLELLGGPEGAAAHDRLDSDALLARNPEVALVDDLAGPDLDGTPRAAAVPRLLDAGITLIATLHLAALRSMAGAMGSILAEVPGSHARQTLTTEILMTRGHDRGRVHSMRGTLHRLVRMLAGVDVHVLAGELDAQTRAAGRLNARPLRGS